MNFLNNFDDIHALIKPGLEKVSEFYKHLDEEVLNDILPNLTTNDSVQTTVPEAAPPSVNIKSPESDGPVTYEMMRDYAEQAGARFPDLPASQWALESGSGKAPSGDFNYFGIQAGPNEPGVWLPTTEYRNGVPVTEKAKFKHFPSPQASINELVNRWYKNYKGYTGANSQPTIEAAAQYLYNQGYATDPKYAAKLLENVR